MIRVGLMVQRALVATATTGVLTVAVAPLASADPPPKETVSNYGHCVTIGLTEPSEGVEGPLNGRLDENGELVYLHLPPGQFKTGGTLAGCIK